MDYCFFFVFICTEKFTETEVSSSTALDYSLPILSGPQFLMPVDKISTAQLKGQNTATRFLWQERRRLNFTVWRSSEISLPDCIQNQILLYSLYSVWCHFLPKVQSHCGKSPINFPCQTSISFRAELLISRISSYDIINHEEDYPQGKGEVSQEESFLYHKLLVK